MNYLILEIYNSITYFILSFFISLIATTSSITECLPLYTLAKAPEPSF